MSDHKSRRTSPTTGSRREPKRRDPSVAIEWREERFPPGSYISVDMRRRGLSHRNRKPARASCQLRDDGQHPRPG